MSGAVHLVGGGLGGDGAVWRGFLEHAAARAGGAPPRIVVVSVRGRDRVAHASTLVQILRASGPLDPVVHAIREGAALPDDLLGARPDGVLVGGGLTPAYLDALAPHAARLRGLVADGTPYAGFSAGSAIAAERALVGGWRRERVPVLAEHAAEDLDELTVRDGLGLVPMSVDVHAAQWGTLARLVAAVADGLVPRGVAVDEDTALVVDEDGAQVRGVGSAWWVDPGEDAVRVRREPAAGT